MEIKLKPGDIFGTRNPMMLGRAINAIQFFWSHDNESTYSHSGIIETPDGDTYEALWRVREGHLSAYHGQQIIIARFTSLDNAEFNQAMFKLKRRHHKQLYPFWRLPLHLVPPMAKFLSLKGKRVVCSELVAELEYYLGLRHGQFVGANPDRLADEWKKWQGWEIVGEGKLSCDGINFFIGE